MEPDAPVVSTKDKNPPVLEGALRPDDSRVKLAIDVAVFPLQKETVPPEVVAETFIVIGQLATIKVGREFPVIVT